MTAEANVDTVGVGGAEEEEDQVGAATARKARLIARLILACLGLISATVLGEVGVRVIAPQQLILLRPDLWRPVDTVGWFHQPNVETEINTGERTVSVFTDDEGFRVGADGPLHGDRQVLLLGDSYIEALQVEFEQSSAGLLQAGLSEVVGEPVAVRNAGVGGWDSDQFFLMARSLMGRHEYDVVVTAIYVGNDVVLRRREHVPPREPLQRYRFRLPRALTSGEFTDAFLRPVNDFLEVRSHLFLFFRNQLKTVRMSLGLAPLYFPPEFLRSEATSERWDVTAEICADIAALAEQHGAAALFVLVPTSFQVNADELRSYVEGYDLDVNQIDLEQPNRIMTARLAELGLSVLDPLPAYHDATREGANLFGAVDPHFTPEGNALFAELLIPAVAEMLRDRDTMGASGR